MTVHLSLLSNLYIINRFLLQKLCNIVLKPLKPACLNCTDGSQSAPKNFQISYRWRRLSIPIYILIHSNSAIEQFLIHCNTNHIRWNNSYKLFTKKFHFRLIVYSLPPPKFNCREAMQCWISPVLTFRYMEAM